MPAPYFNPKQPVPTSYELIPDNHLVFYVVLICALIGVIVYAVSTGRPNVVASVTGTKIRNKKYLNSKWIKKEATVSLIVFLNAGGKKVYEIHGLLNLEENNVVEFEVNISARQKIAASILHYYLKNFFQYCKNEGIVMFRFRCAENLQLRNKKIIEFLQSEGFEKKMNKAIISLEKRSTTKDFANSD